MGLWANLPIALAPGMGSNVIFAQVVVTRLGVSYPTALTMVLIGACLFLLLSVTRLRERIVLGFPESLRIGMQCGIGLLIAYIGLSNSGLLAHQGGQHSVANLGTPAALLAFAGLLATPALVACRIPAALLLSIAGMTVAGLFLHDAQGLKLTRLPEHLLEFPAFPSEIFLRFDLHDFVTRLPVVLPITLYFFLSDFFSATATLVGVTRRARLMTPEGEIPNARRAYAADGLASILGSALGMPTIVAYVESAAGVEAGGRTGIASVVTAGLFGVALVFWPLISAIPPLATAPALLLVGLMMLEGVGQIDFSRPEDAVPPVLLMVVTVVTTDLMMALVCGVLSYSLIVVATRQWRKLTPMLLALDAILSLYAVIAQSI
jgi:AGZA family xanthine/uracil permease-like MFS transporter